MNFQIKLPDIVFWQREGKCEAGSESKAITDISRLKFKKKKKLA